MRPGAAAVRSHRAANPAIDRIAHPTPDSHALCTPPDEFRAHMTWLRRHCLPMALDALVAAAAGCIPERAVAVTLDDGYLDAFAASDILLAADVPATFFVNSGCCG